MIATTHHIPSASDSSMTAPRSEDCLRWQGQTPGKHRLHRWDSQVTQLGGEDCLGLWAGTLAGVRITCGGIGVAKMAIPSRKFMPLRQVGGGEVCPGLWAGILAWARICNSSQ